MVMPLPLIVWMGGTIRKGYTVYWRQTTGSTECIEDSLDFSLKIGTKNKSSSNKKPKSFLKVSLFYRGN